MFIVLSITSFSQELFIRATVLNKSDNSPISYCHAYFNIKNGSSTNGKGEFILNYSKNIGTKDSLSISCIGFKKKKISFNNINLIKSNTIYLEPSAYNLDDVEVKSDAITPYEILQSALNKLSENCVSSTKHYQCSYYEHIDLMMENKDFTTRTVKGDLILSVPKINRIKRIVINSINEKIHFIAINKGSSKLFADHIKEPNSLKYLIMENTLRYWQAVFYSPKKYNYSIAQVYYDSSFHTSVMEVSISPKDSLSEFAYVSVFITTGKHQILKVNMRYLYSKMEDEKPGKYGIYRYSNTENLLIYRMRKDNKMELSYIHSFSGQSYYDTVKQENTLKKDVFVKLNVLNEVINGEELIKELPEMQYGKNIYNQESNDNKSFELKPEILYIEE